MISNEAIIDAAFNAGGDWIYFFHRDETVSYNWKTQEAKGHVKIKEAYPNLPLAFKSKIDAAFNAGGDWIYFFHGDETVSYNWKTQESKENVKIKDSYPNLPWTSDEAIIDAAFNAGGDWIYFFHRDETVSYNWKTQEAKGHVKIKEAYPNLPLAFKSKIDAAFNAGGDWIYFFHGDETVSYNSKTQESKKNVNIKDAYPNLPWT